MEIGVFVLRYEAVRSRGLPPMKGNLLRSAFGAKCMQVLGQDGYARLFEGRGEGRPPGMEKIPPFAFHCSDRRTWMQKGDVLEVRFVLMNPNALWPLAVEVLKVLGAGLGGGEFRLVADTGVIWDESAIRMAAEQMGQVQELTLEFLTPLRIESKKKAIKKPTFQDLVRALCRRAHAVAVACGSPRPAWADEVSALALAERLEAHSQLVEADWERESRSQNRTIWMGGMIGSLQLRGELAPMLPLLMLGSLAQVGSGVGMGNGFLEIRL